MADIKRLLVESLKAQLSSNARQVMIPAGGALLWQWFIALSSTRTYNQAGPNPIPISEMLGYLRMELVPDHAAPEKVKILQAMDGAYLEHAYARKSLTTGVKPLPARSGRPMTAGVFDAMFG